MKSLNIPPSWSKYISNRVYNSQSRVYLDKKKSSYLHILLHVFKNDKRNHLFLFGWLAPR